MRYQRDGELEFLGRIDQQVKLRGVRMELGEIEMVLRQRADIKEAIVLLQEAERGEKRLVAYLVAQDDQAPPALPELRASLSNCCRCRWCQGPLCC